MVRTPAGIVRRALVLAAVAALTGCLAPWSDSQATSGDRPRVGPPSGSLVVAGGGELGPEIWERFVRLAGGEDARIVVIPTASAYDDFDEDWAILRNLEAAGARDLVLLHTRDRETAQSEEFVAPLERATGVWIPGGRQWRLVDAYLHTRTHEELFRVLERGGAVGGTSAGASIQASFLVRGDPETNRTVMAREYEEGFGFLNGAAVDQHLLARGRQNDLWQVLEIYPDLLGIGIDEGTAVVVQGDKAEVIGRSRVLIYDPAIGSKRSYYLDPGDRFHLGYREPIGIHAEDRFFDEQPADDRLRDGSLGK